MNRIVAILFLALSVISYQNGLCETYTMPEQKIGKNYWVISPANLFGTDKLIYDLLCESMVGLAALDVNEGSGQTMVWQGLINSSSYSRLEASLAMRRLGECDAWTLLKRKDIRRFVKGYVLYDTKNQESINCATVAAHVYRGVMVDKRDIRKIESCGYKCLYDASKMRLSDSWREFKQYCKNDGLVLMPTLTSNQRSTAIAYRLMTVNLYKKMGLPEQGSNQMLIEDILMWLKPLSPVFGWEQGQSEDKFVTLVSRSGNIMVPYDWAVNTPVVSANYRQADPVKIKGIDVSKINFGDSPHYVSFVMSDGDNVQWAINSFDSKNYFDSPDIDKTKVSFGYPLLNLSMMNPAQHQYLMGIHNVNATVIEALGGGYYYADNFGELKDRNDILRKMGERLAFHMQRSDCRVLSLICDDLDSDMAKQAYQAYISANDELSGIIVIQYSPYAAGNGLTMWFKNSQGHDIPVVTVSYSLWNFGNINHALEGTPAYIASKYNQLADTMTDNTFSVTSIHAWSQFKKSIETTNLTAENCISTGEHGHSGVKPALWCIERLNSKFKVVNAEELIWQLRMKHNPEQTKQIIYN